MKSTIILIFTFFLMGSCAPYKSFNKRLDNDLSPRKLRSDIDYVHRKLPKLHPDIFLFIDKEKYDYKFDSLKAVTNTAMTSREFFLELSPLVASIRQGHTKLVPPTRKHGFSKSFDIAGRGTSPLSDFKFELFDNSYYIVENNSCKQGIPVGAELLKINDQNPVEISSRYAKTFSSDGFNETYIQRRLSTGLADFFYYENELADSVLMTFRSGDSITSIMVRHKYLEIPCRDSKIIETKNDSLKNKKETRKEKNYHGYNEHLEAFSKDFRFLGRDSSLAILEVRDFQDGDFADFYDDCFEQLDSLNTKSLIIDLRDNQGGALFDAFTLFKHLTDSSFTFIDLAELASPNSLMYRSLFIEDAGSFNLIFALVYPLDLLTRATIVSHVEETEEGIPYLPMFESQEKKPSKHVFQGDLYVMINGGSFSASCILASNIRALDKAIFVGEETGGAENGTVAGQMALLRLPKSKLRLRCGLMHVKPVHQKGIFGRGIMPDIEIKPDLEDFLQGKDPELEWILEDINSKL